MIADYRGLPAPMAYDAVANALICRLDPADAVALARKIIDAADNATYWLDALDPMEGG